MCYAELQGSWDEEPDLTCYARSHSGTSPLPGSSSFMFWSILLHYGPGKAVGLLSSCSLVLRTNGSLLCGHNGNEPCRIGSMQSVAGSQLQELLAKGILQVVVNHLHN